MVSNTIVSQYRADTIPPIGGNRKIAGGPLYRAEEVLELLADVEGRPVVAWSKKCFQDSDKLGFDQRDLCELVALAISNGNFLGAEWCIQLDYGPWAACDAYSIVRKEWIPKAYKEMSFEYYVKFAISRSGKQVLLASCHLS